MTSLEIYDTIKNLKKNPVIKPEISEMIQTNICDNHRAGFRNKEDIKKFLFWPN